MKLRNLFFLMLAMMLILAACGGGGSSNSTSDPAPAEQPQAGGDSSQDAAETEVDLSDYFITIVTGGTSGVYYPIGGALSTLFEEELGVASSVQATGASVENVNLIDSGNAEIALITGDTAVQAFEGTGPFEDQGSVESVMGIAALYNNYVQIVTTEETGINTFEDLKGRKVGVGAPNSGTELNARMMFEGHGMTYDDITPDYLSFAESVDQMKNGLVDAAILSSGLPNSAILDLATTHSAKLIPISDDAFDYLLDKYAFLQKSVIPAGTYGNEEDVPAFAITNALVASSELPEEVVYLLTKTIFENLDYVHSAHNAAKDIKLETALDGLSIPLHPGAERYYKEVGLLK